MSSGTALRVSPRSRFGGRDRAGLVNLGLLGVVWVLAVVTLGLAGELVPWAFAALGGGAVALAGWRLLRRDEPSVRERGWEAEAVGVALLAAGWLAAMAAAGLTDGQLGAPVPDTTKPARSAPASCMHPGCAALVGAPDHRDRVLQPELGDRQVLREVGPIDVSGSTLTTSGDAEDAEEGLDGLGELLLAR